MSISPWQIVIIVVLLLLLFGPQRLPKLGRSIGEALKNFRKGLDSHKEDSNNLHAKDDTSSEDSNKS